MANNLLRKGGSTFSDRALTVSNCFSKLGAKQKIEKEKLMNTILIVVFGGLSLAGICFLLLKIQIDGDEIKMEQAEIDKKVEEVGQAIDAMNKAVHTQGAAIAVQIETIISEGRETAAAVAELRRLLADAQSGGEVDLSGFDKAIERLEGSTGNVGGATEAIQKATEQISQIYIEPIVVNSGGSGDGETTIFGDSSPVQGDDGKTSNE